MLVIQFLLSFIAGLLISRILIIPFCILWERGSFSYKTCYLDKYSKKVKLSELKETEEYSKGIAVYNFEKEVFLMRLIDVYEGKISESKENLAKQIYLEDFEIITLIYEIKKLKFKKLISLIKFFIATLVSKTIVEEIYFLSNMYIQIFCMALILMVFWINLMIDNDFIELLNMKLRALIAKQSEDIESKGK